jgi:ubiquinol-cytochrome c reductase cytochrome b subunit
VAAAYPFIESRLTKDARAHHLLQRPRDAPVRTGLGAMALTFVSVLFVAGGSDTVARVLHISLDAMIWAARIALLTLPPIAYFATYRICLGLQQDDRDVLEHGIETGIVRMLPTGEFIEVHQPLGPVGEDGRTALPYAGVAVPKRINQLGVSRPMRRIRGFFYPVREDPNVLAAIDGHEQQEPVDS